MILITENPNSQGYAIRTRAYAFIQKPIDREYFRLSPPSHSVLPPVEADPGHDAEHVKRHLDALAELQRRVAEHAAASARSLSRREVDHLGV